MCIVKGAHFSFIILLGTDYILSIMNKDDFHHDPAYTLIYIIYQTYIAYVEVSRY